MTLTPLISIVTVTRGRRNFISNLIHSIVHQDIGVDRIEWIVVDEGIDPIFDCVVNLDFVKYYYQYRFNTLGEKRNLANQLTRGDYVAYFDDDNYAFPKRLSSSLEALEKSPASAIAGASEMYVFDNELKRAYVCGPFGDNHATLGTWCFRSHLLTETRFDDTAQSGEEASFTKNWTVPMVQISPGQANVCFDHGQNTVSKKHLLREANELLPLSGLIPDVSVRKFFEDYISPGNTTPDR